jgi:hypothetical protein
VVIALAFIFKAHAIDSFIANPKKNENPKKNSHLKVAIFSDNIIKL